MTTPEPSIKTVQTAPARLLENKPRLRKCLYWCGGTVIVVAVLLVLLPIGIKAYAQSWLQKNGAPAASIEDIDLNLFTGRLLITNLQAGSDTSARLHIGRAEADIRWWPLTSKRLHIEAIKIDDAQADIIVAAEQPLQVGQLRFPPAADAVAPQAAIDANAKPWGLGSELISLTNITLGYHDSSLDTEVVINELMLGSQANWDTERSTPLTLDLAVDGSPFKLKSDISPWAASRHLSGSVALNALRLDDYQELLQQFIELDNFSGALSLELTLDASLNPQGVITLNISGPVSLTDFTLLMPTLAVRNTALLWNAQTDINFPATADKPLLSMQGSLQLEDSELTLPTADIAATLSMLDWNGLVTLSAADNESNNLLLDGALSLTTLNAKLATLALDSKLAALNWSGTVSTSEAGANVQGTLTAEQLALNHNNIPFDLLSLNALTIADLQLEPSGALTLPDTRLLGLRLLGSTGGSTTQNPDLLTLSELNMLALNIDAARTIKADSISLLNPAVNLVRNTEGGFNRIDETLAAFSTSDNTSTDIDANEAASDTNASATTFALGTLNISAENLLAFNDRSVMPAAAFKLGSFELSLKNFASPTEQAASLTLSTSNDSMTLTSEGTLNLLSATPSTDLAIVLSALDLSSLSSYVPGFNIDRGRFSTTSSIKIDGEALDVQNDVLVERLQLTGKTGAEDNALSRGMGMPLDAALALLRDSDDRIALKLPVTGSLSDPQFDITDILRRATQNALQSAAMSYVKNALQPLGALMMLGNLAAEASRPRFEPVAMTAGLASLDNTGQEYLNKIGTLLTERPALQLSICSVASMEDKQALTAVALAAAELAAAEQAALDASSNTDQEKADQTATDPAAAIAPQSITIEISDEEMLQLAGSRTAEVINFLTKQSGVARERLFTCRETIENNAGAGPRTEITL